MSQSFKGFAKEFATQVAVALVTALALEIQKIIIDKIQGERG